MQNEHEENKNVFYRVGLRSLIFFRLYPHTFFTFSPFKIYEFAELQRGLKISKDEMVLDIGCGSGLQTMLIGKKCKKVIGIDISEKAITIAKSISHYMKGRFNIEFRCIKLENANFENEFFDRIFSFCVIEHISNYSEILKEAHRILKNNGQMIFSVDSLENIKDIKLVEKHKKQHFVEKYFKKEELKTILEEIGFKRIEIYPIFKSNFARELFIEKVINRSSKFGFIIPILTYWVLRYEEYKYRDEDKGIFLIAKCYK
ncbi:Arsenite methyltransferase [Methanosarcinales archaeon]|nr:Arsenite methyltransferase [Methanosarcinales archaeon]